MGSDRRREAAGVANTDEEREIIAGLECSLGSSFEAHASDLPADGPPIYWIGADLIAWVGTRARIRDELEGMSRAALHPLAPELVAHSERALVVRARPFVPDDSSHRIMAAAEGVPRRFDGTVHAMFDGFASPISIPRALARIAGRAHADRLLARRLTVSTPMGPVLGGLHPGWLRVTPEGRAVTLSMRHARSDGYCMIDRAAPEVFGFGTPPFETDIVYDLALLAGLLREMTLGRGATPRLASERVKEIVERLLAREDKEIVRVQITAPSWFDTSRWEGELPIARARWIVRELDGLAVGGTTLKVQVDPPIRAGRAAPPWRPRGERRRELFSRWGQGIRADDEGLFSATPEMLADRIAEGAEGIVMDGTCGIGAIALALARKPGVERVIAVDTDRARLEMAAHNARIYEVAHRIRFVLGDVREILERERVHRLFLDPPWGGREYDRRGMRIEDFSLDIRRLIAAFEGPIVLKLPRSFDVSTLPRGFTVEAGIDARGILKMLIARRLRAR